MLEMRRPVPQPDLRRHADPREEFLLEAGDVEGARIGARMQIEVEHRAGGVLDRCEALVEGARREQPLQQRLGQRLAGTAMPGKAAQGCRHFEPMLEYLRWEFDEIAPHGGTGLRRVADLAEQTVQSMAEFVEQG